MILRDVVVDYLLKKDGEYCQLCQLPFSLLDPPTIDHIKSVKAGGLDRMDNLQLLHGRCNSIKGSGVRLQRDPIVISRHGELARAAMTQYGGVKRLAASHLNISLRTLYRWLPSLD